MSKPSQIHFDITDAQLRWIEELSSFSGTTKVETVRRIIKLAIFIHKSQIEGNQLSLISPEGKLLGFPAIF